MATLDGYILLHAINPSQNVWRFYEMRFQRDLFGGYTTTICFGRISSPSGTKKELVFSSTEEQLIHAKNILKKRLSSKQRIGIDYSLITCSKGLEAFLLN